MKEGDSLKILSKLRKSERGQSLVEFALVLPIILLLSLGVLEYGWMLNTKITVTAATREGARAASVLGKDATDAELDSTATLVAERYMGVTLGVDDVTVSTPGDDITINLSYVKAPLVGIYIKTPMTISSQVTMKRE